MFNLDGTVCRYPAELEAIQTLREANRADGTSVRALFDTFAHRHNVRGDWESCLPLADGSIPFVGAGAVHRENYDYDFLEIAVGAGGIYIVIADWPGDDIYGDHANVTVSVAFVPKGARAECEVISMLEFRLTDLPVGDDLLASLYRESPHTEAIRQVLENLLAENHKRARQIVQRHDFGIEFAERPEPYTFVPDDLALLVAERPYPEKQLMIGWEGEVEDWIAEVPGRGILRMWASPQNLLDYLGEDGTYELFMGGPPDWIDETTVFRPTDEKRDPGLAGRFSAAREISREPAAAHTAVEEEEEAVF